MATKLVCFHHSSYDTALAWLFPMVLNVMHVQFTSAGSLLLKASWTLKTLDLFLAAGMALHTVRPDHNDQLTSQASLLPSDGVEPLAVRFASYLAALHSSSIGTCGRAWKQLTRFECRLTTCGGGKGALRVLNKMCAKIWNHIG